MDKEEKIEEVIDTEEEIENNSKSKSNGCLSGIAIFAAISILGFGGYKIIKNEKSDINDSSNSLSSTLEDSSKVEDNSKATVTLPVTDADSSDIELDKADYSIISFEHNYSNDSLYEAPNGEFFVSYEDYELWKNGVADSFDDDKLYFVEKEDGTFECWTSYEEYLEYYGIENQKTK